MGLRSLIIGFGFVCAFAFGCTTSVSIGTVGVGGGCVNDYDCVSSAFCDQGTGVCTDFGTIPIGAACNDDRDCDIGDFCDPVDLVCVAADPNVPNFTLIIGDGCIYDEECVSGAYCDHAGFCVADTFSSGTQGFKDPCFEDLDCASPYSCDFITYTCE
jgi:hypothetical protein